MEVFQTTGKEFPITKSGFITSEHCSILTTGLCIELAEKDYDIDEPKGEMITNPDFECFAEYANAHGFLIDKYVPWRLVADINSVEMKEYMVRGRNIETTRAIDFFESTYTTRSCYDDLYLMRNYLLAIYYPLYRNSTGDLKPIPPIPISRLVEILFKIRTIELGLHFEDFLDVNQKILDMYDAYGLRYIQGYIGELAADKLKEVYKPR